MRGLAVTLIALGLVGGCRSNECRNPIDTDASSATSEAGVAPTPGAVLPFEHQRRRELARDLLLESRMTRERTNDVRVMFDASNRIVSFAIDRDYASSEPPEFVSSRAVRETFAYDDRGNLVQYRLAIPVADDGEPLYPERNVVENYQYDDDDRLVSWFRRETVGASEDPCVVQETFAYDASSRLVGFQRRARDGQSLCAGFEVANERLDYGPTGALRCWSDRRDMTE